MNGSEDPALKGWAILFPLRERQDQQLNSHAA